MKGNKGVTIFVAIMLLLAIAIILVFSFFVFSQESLESIMNKTGGKTEKDIQKRGVNFYIKEIKGTNVTIVNNGKIKLPVEDFIFFFNNTKVETKPYGTEKYIDPEEEMKFNMTNFALAD